MSSPRSGAHYLIVALLVVYFAAVAMRVLAFYPGRHILAFTPVVFVLTAIALGDIVKSFRIQSIFVCFVWLLVAILGILSLPSAIAKSRRITIGPVGSGISKVYLSGWAEPLEYINFGMKFHEYETWGVNVPVEVIRPASFAPEVNKTYLYISKTKPFQDEMEELAKKRPDQKSQPVFQVLNEYHYTTGACFTGFPVNGCSYGEPNQIYKTEFRLINPGP